MYQIQCGKLKIVILAIICFVGGTCADLSASSSKRCGTAKICRTDEYCTFQNQCSPCAEICTEGLHNFQESDCRTQCQEYLHDIRYVRNDGPASGSVPGKEENLRAVVQRLQYIVTVTLTLTCITLLAVIVIVTLQICKWKRNGFTIASLISKICSKKSNNSKSSGNGLSGVQASGKPDLRLEMPTPGTQSENSPATLTTSISRRPAEDSALDYAYDNRGMSSSPSPNSKPHESNF